MTEIRVIVSLGLWRIIHLCADITVCVLGSFYFAHRFGCRRVLLFLMILGAAATVTIVGANELQLARWAAQLFAHATLGGAHVLKFVIAAEIFPTGIRATATGICSMMGLAGWLLARFCYAQWQLHSLIAFSICSMCGAVCAWLLPERKVQTLNDVVEDQAPRRKKGGYARFWDQVDMSANDKPKDAQQSPV
jgi:MFS family permease